MRDTKWKIKLKTKIQNMKLIIVSLTLLLAACSPKKPKPVLKVDKKDLSKYADTAYTFCRKNNLNKNFYFLIDLKEHSGYKRFYVWDFTINKSVDTFMVSHGCGKSLWQYDLTRESPSISNTPNSHCSSVGKYIIQERGCSKFGIGIKYNLKGVDKTNNNARKRAIVLHSWDKVSDFELYPDGTAEGWGCPAVSNNSMVKLDNMLKNKKENTLMWIIN